MPKPPEVFLHVLQPGDDPVSSLAKILHDCPECRAALARGEQPEWGFPEIPPRKKRKLFPRLPRWRTRKQGR